MANKIVQLQNKDGDDIFPVSAGLASDSITTDMIQDGAVMSDKIDLSTKSLTATLVTGSATSTTATGTTTLRVTKLGNGLFMVTGHAAAYVKSDSTQFVRVITPYALFADIYGYSMSGSQNSQAGSYLMYNVAQPQQTLIDAWLHCPNTGSQTNIHVAYIVIGELTAEAEQTLFGD